MTANKIRGFVELIARMETSEEFDIRTDYEGMSGDDAVETLSGLISYARKILNSAEHYEQ